MGCALAAGNSYLPWLMVAGVGCGLSSPGIYAFCQRIAGPEAVGRWYGPQNGFANFAGIIGPSLTGFVLDHTGSFFWPFAVTSAISLIGVVAWVFIVGEVEPVVAPTRLVPVGGSAHDSPGDGDEVFEFGPVAICNDGSDHHVF